MPNRTTITTGRPRRARGFTLLEVVMAFSILAIGLTMAMGVATNSMRQARQAADHTVAALHAQTLLDNAGLDERLEPGDSSGEFEDGYTWQLSVQPYEPQADVVPEGLDGLSMPVELLELELVVAWERGEQRREARFRTLRAMLPDTLR